MTRPSPAGTSPVCPMRTRAMRPLYRGGLAEPGALPFPEESGLANPDVQVIPGEGLRHVAEARVEGGIAVPVPERAAPIAVEIRRHLDEVRESTVTAGEESLEACLPRVLVHDADREPPRSPLDDLELLLEAPDVVERGPLKRRPRLRHERGHRQRELAERVAVRPGHPEPLEHAVRQVRG